MTEKDYPVIEKDQRFRFSQQQNHEILRVNFQEQTIQLKDTMMTIAEFEKLAKLVLYENELYKAGKLK